MPKKPNKFQQQRVPQKQQAKLSEEERAKRVAEREAFMKAPIFNIQYNLRIEVPTKQILPTTAWYQQDNTVLVVQVEDKDTFDKCITELLEILQKYKKQ